MRAHRHPRNGPALPGQEEIPGGNGRRQGPHRRGNRAGPDRGGRGPHLCRGGSDERQKGADHHGLARRHHARISPGRVDLYPQQCFVIGHCRGFFRASRYPYPRTIGSHPEGRTLGRGHDPCGAGVASDQQTGAAGRCHDRRDHPDRQDTSGIQEKVLAARRAKIRTIIVPARNGPDIAELPPHILADLDIILADSVADIVQKVLV